MSHVMVCTGLFDRKYSEVLPGYDHHTCKIVTSISTKEETDRCENYRGTAYGNAAYKILSNIKLGKIKLYIQKITGDYQNRFRNGRSVIDNIFALKIINEKIWEYNQSVQYLFIDFQKAYDSIYREML